MAELLHQGDHSCITSSALQTNRLLWIDKA